MKELHIYEFEYDKADFMSSGRIEIAANHYDEAIKDFKEWILKETIEQMRIKNMGHVKQFTVPAILCMKYSGCVKISNETINSFKI